MTEGKRNPALPPTLKASARRLRREMTPAERRLWSRLRGRRFAGRRFRRQHPVPPYVVDFACVEARLAIEADGSQHATDPRDVTRETFLAKEGWRVLRFWNSEIVGNIDGVLTAIEAALAERVGQ